jgi:hypothetical protein
VTAQCLSSEPRVGRRECLDLIEAVQGQIGAFRFDPDRSLAGRNFASQQSIAAKHRSKALT